MLENTTGWPVVDDLPVDENGFYIVPYGYPFWHEAVERNRQRMNELLKGIDTDLASLSENKANVGAPTWYTLEPIGELVIFAYSRYCKTQENIVYLEFVYNKPGYIPFEFGQLALLPKGFRPEFSFQRVVHSDTYPTGTRQQLLLYIEPDGAVNIHGFQSTNWENAVLISGHVSFVAAQ